MTPIESLHPPRVPSELGGRWIAWNHERLKVVTNGTTLTEARAAAQLAGESRPFPTKDWRRNNCRIFTLSLREWADFRGAKGDYC